MDGGAYRRSGSGRWEEAWPNGSAAILLCLPSRGRGTRQQRLTASARQAGGPPCVYAPACGPSAPSRTRATPSVRASLFSCMSGGCGLCAVPPAPPAASLTNTWRVEGWHPAVSAACAPSFPSLRCATFSDTAVYLPVLAPGPSWPVCPRARPGVGVSTCCCSCVRVRVRERRGPVSPILLSLHSPRSLPSSPYPLGLFAFPFACVLSVPSQSCACAPPAPRRPHVRR